MKQANLTAPEEFTFEEVDKPSLGPNDVNINVKVCGVCGSDIHSYQGKHPFVKPPIVLGHEFSGVVESVGDKVEEFSSGDRVTVEPNMPCWDCYNCNRGDYNICQNLQVIGNVGYSGAFAEYISVPSNRVVAIPDRVTFEQGALIEPLAVGIHAVRISQQEVGDNVVVLGAGTIGLLTASSAVAAGAREVITTDLFDNRLELAEELGVDLTYNSRYAEDELDEVIKSQFGAAKSDLIYDCVGIEPTLNQGLSIARKGSQIMLVGVPGEDLTVNAALIQDGEIDLKGSLMYVRRDFLEAIDLVESGQIDVNKLISHRFAFKDIDEAFELAVDESKNDETMKILVKME